MLPLVAPTTAGVPSGPIYTCMNNLLILIKAQANRLLISMAIVRLVQVYESYTVPGAADAVVPPVAGVEATPAALVAEGAAAAEADAGCSDLLFDLDMRIFRRRLKLWRRLCFSVARRRGLIASPVAVAPPASRRSGSIT